MLVFNADDDRIASAGKYIRIEYKGEMNKPIPTVIFYIPGSFDTTTLKFGDAFQISATEFDSLAKMIIESKLILKSKIKRSFYEFTIVKTKEKSVFNTIDKNSTQIVFDSIIGAFRNDNKKKSIKDEFDYIMKRL